MKICIVTPAPRGSTRGNRITAERWAGLLRKLGHRVTISQDYRSQQVDLLIALHARRSHSSVVRFRQTNPQRPIVLALTGTDVYQDIHEDSRARESLKIANTIVVLQPQALRELKAAERKKARVIYQSQEPLRRLHRSRPRAGFEVCVIGHMRPLKDPFRAAIAARRLPEHSRIRVIQIGSALSKQMAERARREMHVNRRFRWLGELSRGRALRILSQSRLCVISSRLEGGANALSEAIVEGVPVLASRISGNTGILGEDYPGLFRAGDTSELAQLMLRAETDRRFLADLRKRVIRLAPRFQPAHEQRAWARLIATLA
jgi:putative glycosyltransferase (TIGR04348 family)